MGIKDSRFKTIVIAESKRFRLVQEDVYQDDDGTNDDDERNLHLYFDGVLVAQAGCGCCVYGIERKAAVAMIEAMKAGE